MKILYIFRGENLRTKRGIQSALDCIKNWKETLFDVSYEYDIAFVTFPSEILEELEMKLNPKYVILPKTISQEHTIDRVIDLMSTTLYDRYVILRFDFLYKIKIEQWPHWNSNGIILVNKDVHWPKQKLYADIVFIVDRDYIESFKHAKETNPKAALHHIGKYLENNKHFYLMYKDYYHMDNHPLHSVLNLGPYPDLNHYNQGEKILDLSVWNQ